MSKDNAITIRSTIILLMKFMLLVPFVTAAWWMLVPYYGHVLLQAAGSILRFILQVPIQSGNVSSEGILNTESMLTYTMQNQPIRMNLALLSTNLAPYIALILATKQILLKKRVKILALGSAIIVATHILCTIVFFYLIYNHIEDAAYLEAGSPPLYVTLTQFLLTLPFLLWIVLAYWPQLQKSREGDTPQEGN